LDHAVTSRPPADLKPLTSLRFFAAAMIVALHLQETLDVPWPDVCDRGLRQGVTFFFVLSGFILTHVYSDQPGLTVRTFLTLRLARLYPTQLAALLLLVLLLPWREIVYTSPSADVSATALVAKLLLIDALWPTAPLTYSWNGVSWSLSTEMFFYLAFPLLLANFRADWPKKLALAALLAFAAYLGAQAMGLPFGGSRANELSLYQIAYCEPVARGFEFVLGMCAYRGYERFIIPMSLSKRQWTCAEGALLALLVAWISVFSDAIGRLLPNLSHLWLMVSGSCFLFAIAFAVLAPARGWFGQALSARWLVWLGQISFSLYMTHEIVMRAFAYYWGRQAPLALVVAAALAVAAANFAIVEGPARRAILALIKRGPAAAPA
jgi:peptidoglycan/LPS O-acetylase OafA/YrhL